MSRNIKRLAWVTSAAACLFLSLAFKNTAYAVPSFKRQNGMNCTACHTVFPELTPFGRAFKLGGYTFSNQSPSKEYPLPLAAMVQLSYTTLEKSSGILEDGIAPFDDPEDSEVDKTELPQEASLFYAGRVYGDHIGAFVQLTYEGTSNDIFLDMTDIRYAAMTKLAGRELIYGVSLNNAPGVEDVWNSTPIWGFPFASSEVAPTPSAGTVIDGALAEQVGGVGIYGFWSNMIYLAGSVYRTTYDGITRPLGAGTAPSIVTDDAVPYWRAALQQTWDKQTLEFGTYGLIARIFPGGAVSGATDRFTDTALDAEYQINDRPNLFTLRTTWIHEKQDLDASVNQGLAANDSNTLQTFRINGSYYYRSTLGDIGGSLGYFSTTGDTDTLLYAPEPVTGSRNGSPDSKGYIAELAYVVDEYRFSLQYIVYSEFNGSHTDYDGSGRDAQDNNTLYALAWLMF